MKKLMTLLLVLMLCLGMAGAASALEYPNGGTVLYDANGNIVTNGTLGDGTAVVELKKTVDQYRDANNNVEENEFVVTLQVRTSQKLTEIVSETPDTAVLLMMDVSNSMDDCITCGKESGDNAHRGSSTTTYYCNGTSGDTFSARNNGGNNWTCRHCGKWFSQHNAVTTTSGGSCAYQARLVATKNAAKDFLYEFATETGAQTGDRRMVAIVSYGTHAVTELNWVDINTTAGMYAAEQAIENLTIANGNHSYSLQGGGTSIESALALGRNLLGAQDISNITYRYSILMTDGIPTYGVSKNNNNIPTGTSSVSGSTSGSGSSTESQDYDDVANLANAIRETNKSKLYSICFGTSNGQAVWDQKPFGNNTTVGQWMTGFSTAAYTAANATSAQLFDTFNSVLAQIQVAAKAWKVEDWMGDYVHYHGAVQVDKDGGGYLTNHVVSDFGTEEYPTGTPAFVWDLLTSDNDPAISRTSGDTTILGYTYKYRITLDNLDAGYSTINGAEEQPSNKPTAANTRATLRYATTDSDGNWPERVEDYKIGTFPVPQIQGLVGNLSFEKVDQEGKPLVGWVFRLSSNTNPTDHEHSNNWAYLEATSDQNGVVSFTGIPSGHSYTLQEVSKPADKEEHYLDVGDMDVNVAWGNASVYLNNSLLGDGNDAEDSLIEVVNHYSKQGLGRLTIQKQFGAGSVIPETMQFTVTGPNGYHNKIEMYASDMQAGEIWSWVLTGLPYGEYTIQESNAADVHGSLLRSTHDVVYSIYVNDVAKAENVTFKKDVNEPETKVTLDYDTLQAATVKFVNTLTPKEGKLNIRKSFVELPTTTDISDLVISVTATPVTPAGAAIAAKDPVTLNLAWDASLGTYAVSTKLPIGYYLLDETVTGGIQDYSLAHSVFATVTGNGTGAFGDADEGVNLTNGIIHITDTADVALVLKNHYHQDEGHIHIAKYFTGELSDAHFKENDRFFKINIRKDNKDGEIVASVELTPGDDNWSAASPHLPVGTYYLEEVVAPDAEDTAYVDGYNHQVIWPSGSTEGETVRLTKDVAVTIALTNNYTKQVGYISVSKTFAAGSDLQADYFTADENRKITITIKDAEGIIADTLVLPVKDANDQWQWTDTSIALTPGKYTLTETGMNGYDLTTKWNDETKAEVEVTVTDAVTAGLTLENDYQQQTGFLTVTKNVEGLPDELKARVKVSVSIFADDANKTLKRELILQDGAWSETVELPWGTYILEENVATDAALSDYAMVPTWEGLLADNKITIGQNHTDAAPATVTLTNTYTNEYGYLTIEKKLTGLESQDSVFRFQIVKADDATSIQYAEVEVGSNGTGRKQVKLPVGQYKVQEVVTNPTESSKYEVSYETNSSDVTIGTDGWVNVDVKSAAEIAFTCTNDHVPKVMLNIPVEKTVKSTGNTAPGTNKFVFTVDWDQTLPVTVEFVNDSENTAGQMEKIDDSTYAITVEGAATVKGVIAITGYADDLDNFILTTSETLNPYASEQAAKNAHWTYDQTALDDTLCWTVTLKKEADVKVGGTIALGQEVLNVISFENVYDHTVIPNPPAQPTPPPVVPDVPETGDGNAPMLYLLLAVLSLGGMVLLRRKWARG